MATQQIRTYCGMCVSRCGVLATVEDGVLTKVVRDPGHPNGCICVKGAAAPEIVYSPDRLRYPMMRTRPKTEPDPGWRRISWGEALDLAAKRVLDIKDRYGAEAVVFSRATPAGSASIEFEGWLQRLANAFGSPNLLATTHICIWNRIWGAKHTYGVPTPAPDFENTRCILLWGTNPEATDPCTALRIWRAQTRGTRLIVIDPRRHSLARRADPWLRLRPGSDGVLALAMIHVLLDERLYDDAFARDWTTAPFLVRQDTRQLLTGQDLGYNRVAPSVVAWDIRSQSPVVYAPAEGFQRDDIEPALSGRFAIPLSGGDAVACQPALDVLGDIAAEYSIPSAVPYSIALSPVEYGKWNRWHQWPVERPHELGAVHRSMFRGIARTARALVSAASSWSADRPACQ